MLKYLYTENVIIGHNAPPTAPEHTEFLPHYGNGNIYLVALDGLTITKGDRERERGGSPGPNKTQRRQYLKSVNRRIRLTFKSLH